MKKFLPQSLGFMPISVTQGTFFFTEHCIGKAETKSESVICNFQCLDDVYFIFWKVPQDSSCQSALDLISLCTGDVTVAAFLTFIVSLPYSKQNTQTILKQWHNDWDLKIIEAATQVTEPNNRRLQWLLHYCSVPHRVEVLILVETRKLSCKSDWYQNLTGKGRCKMWSDQKQVIWWMFPMLFLEELKKADVKGAKA